MRNRKLLLLLSPALFFFGACGWSVWGSYGKVLQSQEAQAAVILPVAQFKDSYRHGQRWVEFEGKLAMDQHRQEKLLSRRKEPLVGIIAPLVPPDWAPADPVHVLVYCGNVTPENVQAKLADLRARPRSIVASEPTPRTLEAARADFPNLNFEEPVILVEGVLTEPIKPDVTSTIAWFVVLLTAFVVWLVFLVRQFRREFARIDEQGGSSGQ